MKRDIENVSVPQSRRNFIESSTATLATLLTSTNLAFSQKSVAKQSRQAQPTSGHFNFGDIYDAEETKQLLLHPEHGKLLGGPTGTGLPFWWDVDAKTLVNPTNVTFDPKVTAADYQLAATLLNFRASQTELGDVWKKLTNNAQLNINPGSVSDEGDPLQWIVMTGINVAQSIFSPKDSHLAPLTQNNKPTDTLRPAEAATFKKGICSLAITLSAQKKNSLWDKLLATVKAVVGSPIFGMLPIPKLYQTAIQSVTASLNQLESQSHLVTVLGGRSYNYKLYQGANSGADLTFRPGHWVVIDSTFAAAHMDSKSNLVGVYLDIPGLLYQLKDKNNQVVDTTYTVAYLDLTTVPSH
jgi:hypothetical protein